LTKTVTRALTQFVRNPLSSHPLLPFKNFYDGKS
jgi:hypothetical protein